MLANESIQRIEKFLLRVQKTNSRKERLENEDFQNLLILIEEDIQFVENEVKKIVERTGGHFFKVSPDFSEFNSYRRVSTPNKLSIYLAPDEGVIDELNQPDTVVFIENLTNLENDRLRWSIINFCRDHYVLDQRDETTIKQLQNICCVVVVLSEPIDSKELYALRVLDGKDSFMSLDLRRRDKTDFVKSKS